MKIKLKEEVMYVEGSANNDLLTGFNNDDIYDAKEGNDIIKDYSGSDIYLINKNSNWDTVTDTSGNDSIKFGEGITLKDLQFSFLNESNLKIRIVGTTSGITVINWSQYKYKIENIMFQDGKTLNVQDIKNILGGEYKDPPIPGGDDTGGDIEPPPPPPPLPVVPTIIGTDGYDVFKFNNGNDIYYTKKGNDYIKDYFGNDSYLFFKGDGIDTIYDSQGNDKLKFGEGITLKDLTFKQLHQNLAIYIDDKQDGKVEFTDWMNSSKFQAEKIEFSDGSYLTNTIINKVIQDYAAFIAVQGVCLQETTAFSAPHEIQNIVVNPGNIV
jgi:Ca2+-binding RTX toxin-like protein